MLLEPASRPPRSGLLLMGVLLAVLAAYSGALGAPFIWDDHALIERAPRALDSVPLTRFFAEPFWLSDPETATAASTAYYRPLTTLTYAIDWSISAGKSVWYHVVNIAWHLAVTALVFALGRRAGASGAAAALGALVFGLAPRLTENVAWISGRTDVLAACFALGALALHRDGPGSAWRRVGAALLLLAGLLCKEVAFVALPAIAAGALVRGREQRRPLLAVVRDLLPSLAALAVYAALRFWAMRDIPSQPYGLGVGVRLTMALQALGTYTLMVLDPLRPRLQIGVLGEVSWGLVGLGVAVALGLAALAVTAVRRRWAAPVVEALVLALGAIGLVLHVIPIRVSIVAADRFLYIPLAGIAVACAAAATRLAPSRRRVLGFATLALAVVSLVATNWRNRDWADEERLWRVAVATTQDSNNLPRYQLANWLFRSRRYEEALAGYRSLRHETQEQHLDALSDIAALLSELGQYDEARDTLRQVIAQRPKVPLYWYNLGLIEMRRLDFDAGERDLTQALALFPGYPEARALLERSAPLRDEASRLPPETSDEAPSIRARRAALYARLGRDRDAAQIYARLIDSPGASIEALLAAARHLAVKGPIVAAEKAIAVARERGAAPGDMDLIVKALEARQRGDTEL